MIYMIIFKSKNDKNHSNATIYSTESNWNKFYFFFRIWLKQKLLAQEAQEDKPIENLPDNCIGLFHSARGQLYSCRWCNTVTPLASGSTHIYI